MTVARQRSSAARKLHAVGRNADQDLARAALQASKNAFAPYSGFAVGCAVRTRSGALFLGANLETAAFDGIHAEAAALGAWNTAGGSPIESIAVVGYRFWPEVDREQVTTPCGRCRQLILECAVRSEARARVLCCNGALSQIRVHLINELLPYAFELAGRPSPKLKD